MKYHIRFETKVGCVCTKYRTRSFTEPQICEFENTSHFQEFVSRKTGPRDDTEIPVYLSVIVSCDAVELMFWTGAFDHMCVLVICIVSMMDVVLNRVVYGA